MDSIYTHGISSFSNWHIFEKKKDILKIQNGFRRRGAVLSSTASRLKKKIMSRYYATSNIAENHIFFTFRLGYLENGG